MVIEKQTTAISHAICCIFFIITAANQNDENTIQPIVIISLEQNDPFGVHIEGVVDRKKQSVHIEDVSFVADGNAVDGYGVRSGAQTHDLNQVELRADSAPSRSSYDPVR